MPELTLVRVADLIGVSIEGRRADLRSRTADGACMYEHQAEGSARMVTMTRVFVDVDKHGQWMRWEWDKTGHSLPVACGYSAILMDGTSEFEYFILIEVAHA